MAEISAKLVKDLRDKTGAGMMDCKKALAASEGNTEELPRREALTTDRLGST